MAEFTFAPLTPVHFLDRARRAFPHRLAVVDEDVRLTYAEFASRCDRLVSALARSGIQPGDRVAALCANSHIMLELHQAVPARGAALVSINVRLAVEEMHYILEHSGARLLVATSEFASQAREISARTGVPAVVAGDATGDYESWLPDVASTADRVDVGERDLLAINYTSGTTGRPKGVMYHHRGAYLQAVAMAFHADLGPASNYLWTLPMFHCNGWCFTWAVTAAGGTHVCLRRIDPSVIWRQLREADVTHLSAAPTVLAMIAEDPAAGQLPRRVHVDTGGAPPSPALLERLDPLGFDVTHLYGLTETYGPVAVNVWQPEWDRLDPTEAARLRARQGIGNIIARPLRVLDTSGVDVAPDGQTIGEIAVSGNNVMLGYYRDERATAAVTRSGCFLTGDLGVMHSDGYVEIRDRAKDVIISGGENIASVELERALDTHPEVLESAVVGVPHPHWGEVPVAFVTRRTSATVTEVELTTYLRERVAAFKVPKAIAFADLPKTSTGKIQKNVLREGAAAHFSPAEGLDDPPSAPDRTERA
ncbi:acyl-CoA synthetase (AMP-forming)/AMP-acid ligase II [Mycolicibacterium chubuense NBB4]|uniref:Long-chain-fatty-acid--CoA ligase FadD13 n=1 Tax=Mycolicibacterium chubuense (strain NBB4) TaxID=710421 RepID=I4BK95_MYCCN|nr:acyl--CoA ligase family protein [Mycolicibacterium chubuense]AFM17702.1 acyl-CoA synthetase (AMP-forming)/AMP-acid ligase II [Mycolicibacterium chubuense NBB4]